MSAPFCTKCRKKDHPLKGCALPEPWPFHTGQLCDRCGLPGHETGGRSCSVKAELAFKCKTCGHEGHHNTQDCHIKDKTNDAAVRQWTKSKYEAAMASRGTAKAPKYTPKSKPKPSIWGNQPQFGNLPQRPANSPSGSSKSGPFRTSTNSSYAQSGQAGSPAKPRFKKVDRSLLTPDAEQKMKGEWSKHNLDLADFSSVKVPDEKKNDVKIITTNFFRVKIDRDARIHKYRIVLGKINGSEVKKREVKRAMIDDILGGAPPNAPIWVTDYFAHIISVGKLYSCFVGVVGEAWSVVHERPLPGGQDYTPVDSTIFYEGMLQVESVKSFVNPLVPRDPNYLLEEDFRILNLLSWKQIYDARNPAGQIFTIGKKFYPDNQNNFAGELYNRDRKTLCHVKRGFFSSMRPGNGSLLLNVNTATTAFFPPINLQTWITSRLRELSSVRVWKELKNIRVTFHGDAILKPRVILRVSDKNVSNQYFTFNGTSRSVIQHMRLQYPTIGTLLPYAWCVSVGLIPKTSNDIWFPADKLTIIANQPFHGQMTGDMTAQMLRFAAKEPDFNQRQIHNHARGPLGIVTLSGHGQSRKFYSDFGLSIEEGFLTVRSRNLGTPRISFWNTSANNGKGGEHPFDIVRASRYTEYRQNPTQWLLRNRRNPKTALPPRDTASWDLKEVSLVAGRTFRNVVHMHPNQLHIINVCETTEIRLVREKEAQVTTFGNNLINCLRSYGIFIQGGCKVRNAQTVGNHQNLEVRRSQFCANLDAAWHDVCPDSDNPPHDAKLVLVALASTDAGEYADVRWWADCKKGLPCICVAPEGVKRGAGAQQKQRLQLDLGMLGNLALKYNFRLGGSNHYLTEPLGFKEETMIVGADVTHPGKTLDEMCPSMAGVVATYDEHAIQYLASARLQPKNTEHIADLDGMMRERLRAYEVKNDRLPEHILFYRDGISESQYGEVRQKELPQIQRACAAFTRAGAQISITLIIVAKRHHARFYDGPDARTNLHSGLIVDEQVVAPKQFNFYLQAHDSPIGTALNAHYVVLENQSNYSADELQKLTHKLSFTVSRATKGLSVCTPARYADFLCTRLRCYMRPALEQDLGLGPARDVSTYRQRESIWNAPHPGVQPQPRPRTNPWDPRLNGVMFYL